MTILAVVVRTLKLHLDSGGVLRDAARSDSASAAVFGLMVGGAGAVALKETFFPPGMNGGAAEMVSLKTNVIFV